MNKKNADILEVLESGYKEGFSTDVASIQAPKGLTEDIVRFISRQKNEPDWLLDFRLRAFRAWQKMTEPHWLKGEYAPIDYQNLHYYSAPDNKKGPHSLNEVDPKIRETYEKLGIPLKEQEALALEDIKKYEETFDTNKIIQEEVNSNKRDFADDNENKYRYK